MRAVIFSRQYWIRYCMSESVIMAVWNSKRTHSWHHTVYTFTLKFNVASEACKQSMKTIACLCAHASIDFWTQPLKVDGRYIWFLPSSLYAMLINVYFYTLWLGFLASVLHNICPRSETTKAGCCQNSTAQMYNCNISEALWLRKVRSKWHHLHVAYTGIEKTQGRSPTSLQCHFGTLHKGVLAIREGAHLRSRHTTNQESVDIDWHSKSYVCHI